MLQHTERAVHSSFLLDFTCQCLGEPPQRKRLVRGAHRQQVGAGRPAHTGDAPLVIRACQQQQQQQQKQHQERSRRQTCEDGGAAKRERESKRRKKEKSRPRAGIKMSFSASYTMGTPMPQAHASRSLEAFQLRMGPPAMSPPTPNILRRRISGKLHTETLLRVAVARKFPRGLQHMRSTGDTKATTCTKRVTMQWRVGVRSKKTSGKKE